MSRAVRLAAGLCALLCGAATMLLIGWALIRAGLPSAGFKALAYLWALVLAGLVPVSLGVNLLRRMVPWRPFLGWWLLGLAAVHLAGLALAAPELHHYRLDQLPILVGLPLLAFVALAVLLLRRPRQDG